MSVRGLIAGNFDYIVSPAVLDAVIGGRQPLKKVFTDGLVYFCLVAQPEIRSLAELKGKKIGIASPLGGLNDLTMREILRRHGLDPLKDITLVGVGASRERFVALTSGAIHAALFSPPFNFKAVEMGYGKLSNASDYVKRPQVGLGTRDEKILREPQEVSKMVRASLKGLKFVLTEREYIVSKTMQIFNLGREEAVQTYEALREESVPAGYLTDDEERAVISMIKQAANIAEEVPPDRVFDNRFVKQAERELKGWRPQIGR